MQKKQLIDIHEKSVDKRIELIKGQLALEKSNVPDTRKRIWFLYHLAEEQYEKGFFHKSAYGDAKDTLDTCRVELERYFEPVQWIGYPMPSLLLAEDQYEMIVQREGWKRRIDTLYQKTENKYQPGNTEVSVAKTPTARTK